MNKTLLLGAIAGDVIGSVYEANPTKELDFELFRSYSIFTDDTVLTLAVADWLLSKGELTDTLQRYGQKYAYAGYGGSFRKWMMSPHPQPYNSWGNGSAMRVSPVGWFFETLQETLAAAKKSAEVTHNHPEGIKGAQAVAACIYLARTGTSKQEIKEYTMETFGYDLNRTYDEIRPAYRFDVSCQGSVPEAIIAFLDSTDFESTIRMAVALGGDSDTQACIAGSIAEAFYGGVPEPIAAEALKRLPKELTEILLRFSSFIMETQTHI